jgi:hypothetical protein
MVYMDYKLKVIHKKEKAGKVVGTFLMISLVDVDWS